MQRLNPALSFSILENLSLLTSFLLVKSVSFLRMQTICGLLEQYSPKYCNNSALLTKLKHESTPSGALKHWDRSYLKSTVTVFQKCVASMSFQRSSGFFVGMAKPNKAGTQCSVT